jgi:hypothetical protein
MNASLATMDERLRRRITNPEQLQIAQAIATRLAALQLRALAGENVDADIRHMQAQSVSLAASIAGVVTDELMSRLMDVAGSVIRRALAPASEGGFGRPGSPPARSSD